GAHVARAPLGVGLEATGRQYDVPRRYRAGAPAMAHADAVHAVVVGDEPDGPGVVEQGDAVPLRCRRERGHETRTTAVAFDGEAAPELEFAVHLERLPTPDGREPHALGAHPAQRLAALPDQHFGQLRIGAVLGDAIHIVEELILGIGAKVGLGDLLLGQIGHERPEVVNAVIDAAHGAGREAAVAAG